MSISRCVLRWGLIGGLTLGGATLLLGPERVAQGLGMMRAKAQHVVDGAINSDDPQALRRNLERLADEYPERIAEVQGELAEVEHQLEQFKRDIEISDRVVAMTTEDLGELKSLVARAEATQSNNRGTVFVRFEGIRFDINEAYDEARRINQVRVTYEDRMAHDAQQVEFLTEQKDRLNEILVKLETDFATYQTQLWQLDREIDAIERNERLIELTKAQQETLDSFDRYGKVTNLRQLQGKLAELRKIQQAQLKELAKRGIRHDYQREAENSMNMETVRNDDVNFGDPFAEIEIESLEAPESDASDTVAWMEDYTVIESDR